jgi:hypothetical protein
MEPFSSQREITVEFNAVDLKGGVNRSPCGITSYRMSVTCPWITFMSDGFEKASEDSLNK